MEGRPLWPRYSSLSQKPICQKFGLFLLFGQKFIMLAIVEGRPLWPRYSSLGQRPIGKTAADGRRRPQMAADGRRWPQTANHVAGYYAGGAAPARRWPSATGVKTVATLKFLATKASFLISKKIGGGWEWGLLQERSF